MVALRVLALIAGAGIIGVTLFSMVRTVIVPRGEITFIALLVFRPLGRLARALVRRTTRPRARIGS